jgi:hypothetical protein
MTDTVTVPRWAVEAVTKYGYVAQPTELFRAIRALERAFDTKTDSVMTPEERANEAFEGWIFSHPMQGDSIKRVVAVVIREAENDAWERAANVIEDGPFDCLGLAKDIRALKHKE